MCVCVCVCVYVCVRACGRACVYVLYFHRIQTPFLHIVACLSYFTTEFC